jgi:hypothetical protein
MSADIGRVAPMTAAKVKISPKKVVPPPVRKLSFQAALDRTNQKFGKVLAKLAQ